MSYARRLMLVGEMYVAKQRWRKYRRLIGADLDVCFGTRRRPSVGLHTHHTARSGWMCLVHLALFT